jgi:Ca2+-transporting ATPase
VSLNENQWLECAGLAALLPLVVELGNLPRRRRHRRLAALPPENAVASARARADHPVAP